jgi:hypothetical protein
MEKQFANNVVKVRWNIAKGRWEFYLLGKLQAVTAGVTGEQHDKRRDQIISKMKDKGYTVIEDDKAGL